MKRFLSKYTVGSGSGWTVRCGDSLDLLRDLRPATFDMMLTDPPYSSGGLHQSARAQETSKKYGSQYLPSFEGDSKDQISYFMWSVLWMSLAMRALKPGAYFAAWSDHRQYAATHQAMQAAGVTARGVVVWDKQNARPATKAYFTNQCEFALWGTKGAIRKDVDGPFRGVIRCAPPAPKTRLHPCEKPQEAIHHLLLPLGGKGNVLDPFAGSGSVGVASQNLGLNYVGMELDPAYACVARDVLSGVPRTEIRKRIEVK